MDDTRASSTAPAPRRRSWLRLFLRTTFLLVPALVAVAWFLPVIIAATSLRNTLVRAAVPQFRGEIHLGQVSLGWLSPVRVGEVTIRDEAGEPLAEIAEAATAKPLWRLLVDSQNLGDIHLREPTVHATLRDGGSSLEDAIAPLLHAPSSGGVSCVLHIAEGRCELRELDSARQVILQDVTADVTLPAAATEAIQWRMVSKISDGRAAGDATTEGQWRSGAGAWGEGAMKFQTHRLSLAALTPLLTRCGVNAELSGLADMRGEATLTDDGRQEMRLEQLAVEQLVANAPQYLGSDTLQLARLDASGEATLTDETLALRQASVACDIGRLQAAGEAPWDALSASQIVAALRSTSFNLDGELDLARLAERFPQTLRLRKGLTVTSGVVRVACATRDEQNARRWEGRLEASNLAAQHQGRPLAWERPLSATFALRDAANGPVIEQVSCQSDFLQATGSGSLAEGGLTLQGNLSKLSAELARFVDVGEMQFGGALQGEVRWRRGEGEQTAAEGNLRLTDFQWSAPGRRPWREAELTATFAAAGLLDDQGVRRIDQGRVEIKAGADAALVQLRGPVESPSAAAVWPVQCQSSGELASWLPRAENFVSLAGWTLEGRVSVSAVGVVSADRVQLETAQLNVEQLYLSGAGLAIREPRVEAAADLVWDGKSHSLAAQQATFASSSIAFRAQNVAASLQPGAASASGEIDFRGDLQRIGAWIHDPQARPTRNLEGMASGRLFAKHTGRGVHATWTANIENFAYSVPARVPVPASRATPAAQSIAWTSLWREPQLRLSGEATHAPQTDSLELKQFVAAGDAIHVAMQGAVADLSKSCRVDLTGQLDYDLEKLLTLLRPLLGPDLKMTGGGPRPFTVQGPLFTIREPSASPSATAAVLVPPELTAKTSLAWTSAEYCGIRAAAGETPIELTGGIATLGPLDMPVSEGRLTMAPKIHLNAAPMLATLDSGPLLQNVRISPEMCRTWLKYVAPLVADAAQAEGRFSIELTQPARIPLEAPAQGEARGAMKVHAAQVGPGPLSRQFLTLAEQVKAAVERKPFAPGEVGASTWLTMSEQAIAFEMAGGRVYHRDLQVVSRDVTIRTRGSVGLDQTLDLLAEVPIQDRWVEREPLLAGFRGQVLQVPVSGTLTAPRLDGRATEQFARQMVGDAARRILEDNLKLPPKVQGTLDQLFRRQ